MATDVLRDQDEGGLMSLSKMRTVAVGLLAAAIAVTGLIWVSLLASAKLATEEHGVTLTEAFQLDTPDFKKGFSSSLADLSDFRYLFNCIGGARFWILLIAAGVVFYVWLKADLGSESPGGRLLFGSLILMPAVVGLGLAPGLIRDCFAALAEVGLTSPEIIGGGVAEAFAPFILGGVFAVPLLLALVALLRRQTAGDAGA